jgi:hypothetical protein
MGTRRKSDLARIEPAIFLATGTVSVVSRGFVAFLAACRYHADVLIATTLEQFTARKHAIGADEQLGRKQKSAIGDLDLQPGN